MKKRLFGIFVSTLFTMSVGTSSIVLADDTSSRNLATGVQAMAVIEISDPETGKVETFEKEVPISTIWNRGRSSEEPIYSVEARVDLGDYIQSRVSSTGKEENYDGVIISSGMQYTNSGIKYKATKLYGDIEFPNNLYYAGKRHWNARDTSMNAPDCCSKGICPTSDSWSYNTSCTVYEYVSSDTPPFVRYEARIYVRDMSAYRDVNVTCRLEFT